MVGHTPSRWRCAYSIRGYDRLQADDFRYYHRCRHFDRLELENRRRYKCNRHSVGFYSNSPPSQVLKHSRVEHNFIRCIPSRIAFLDEFRLLSMRDWDGPAAHEPELGLVVFDISIPQRAPGSWRFFGVSPTYRREHPRNSEPWTFSVYHDIDRGQGEGFCDGPLVVDPAQSVVVLVQRSSNREAVLVIRAAALLGYISSERNRQRIPWDDWKRHATVMKFPSGVSNLQTFVLGSRVISVTHDQHVQAYDFSRWGCRTFVRDGNGEKQTTIIYNPKRNRSLQEHGNRIQNVRGLGDRLVGCGVSDSYKPSK